MGAGSTPAGTTPAGLDDVASTDTVVLPTLKSPLYDPAIRGFAVQQDGEHPIHVHPVIERASLLLCMRRGASPSSATRGLNVKAVLTASDEDVTNVAADETKIALKPLLDAGDIRIVSVETDRSGPGTAMVVTVANLREPGSTNVPIRRTY